MVCVGKVRDLGTLRKPELELRGVTPQLGAQGLHSPSLWQARRLSTPWLQAINAFC